MSQQQFSVLYNGHGVAVTTLSDDMYSAQVTYKPVTIQMKQNDKGEEIWVDAETQQETFVSQELGKQISQHLCSAQTV